MSTDDFLVGLGVFAMGCMFALVMTIFAQMLYGGLELVRVLLLGRSRF